MSYPSIPPVVMETPCRPGRRFRPFHRFRRFRLRRPCVRRPMKGETWERAAVRAGPESAAAPREKLSAEQRAALPGAGQWAMWAEESRRSGRRAWLNRERCRPACQ